MKEMKTARVLIKSLAGAYCSDKIVEFNFPKTHHILARYEYHEKFFVVVPWEDHEYPLPQWKPTVYDGRVVVNPVRQIEFTREGCCRTGEGCFLWTQTAWGEAPQMCVAEKNHFGWFYTWSYGVEIDLDPALTQSEEFVNTLMNLKD